MSGFTRQKKVEFVRSSSFSIGDFTLTSYGAAGEVTGSKHLLHTPEGSKILLDCGLFQGGHREEALRKNSDFGFDPHEVSAVLLSHAHIDHSGLLPKLAHDGFTGKVFSTVETQELSYLMLLDSAHIQEEDEAFFRKHRIKSPLLSSLPLYTQEDVEELMKQWVSQPYRKRFRVTPDVEAEFLDAGHVLGSAITLLFVRTEKGEKILAFTGDLGRSHMPILHDPERIPSADYLLCESTYGQRSHERVEAIADDLEATINHTARRGGKVFIPAFALERTQEVLLRLEDLIHRKMIPDLPIFIDSPLAVKITQVFEKHVHSFDEEVQTKLKKGRHPFSFPHLQFTSSVEESKALNELRIPAIIIAGSGMCENGRIRHHLKNSLEDARNSILIVGYQAEGTLGRKLVEGHRVVSLFHRDFHVKAQVVVFKSLSAHGDQHDLDRCVQGIQGLRQIFLVHGEEEARHAFSQRIRDFYPGVEVILPERGLKYELEP